VSRYIKELGLSTILESIDWVTMPESEEVQESLPIFEPHPGAQARMVEALKNPNGKLSIWYKGGINAGKSFLGAWSVVYRSEIDPQGRGLITANSYGQLETSTLVALADYCEMFGIPLEPNRGSSEATAKAIAANRHCYIGKKQTFHYVLSADSFTGKTKNSKEVGRGLQVRWVWADEYAYAVKGAFDTIMGRIGRGKGESSGMLLITSSINKNQPYNYCYKIFDDPRRTPEQKAKFLSIAGTSLENLHADDDYIDRMKATLTPELFKLEILSEYVAVTEGLVFKYFDRKTHLIAQSVAKYDRSFPVHASFDFNHSPATAIIAQVVAKEIIIIKEFFLLNSDTFELAKETGKYLRRLSPSKIYIHGDASGNQKTANSKNTNWGIIKDEFNRLKLNWETCYKLSNPSVQDSVNALNASFHHDRLFLSDTCDELIADLESLKWIEGKAEIDKKTDLMRSHLADTLRYLNWDIYPLAQGKSSQDSPTIW
jgi:hypothetical protein